MRLTDTTDDSSTRAEVSSLSAAPEDSGLGVVKVFCPHLWVTTALPPSSCSKIPPWNPFPLPVQSFFKQHFLCSAPRHQDFRREQGKPRELLQNKEPSKEPELLSLVQQEVLTGMLSYSCFPRDKLLQDHCSQHPVTHPLPAIN